MDKNPWLACNMRRLKNDRTEKIFFISQPKINFQTFYRELDSPKQRFKAFEGKPALDSPEVPLQ